MPRPALRMHLPATSARRSLPSAIIIITTSPTVHIVEVLSCCPSQVYISCLLRFNHQPAHRSTEVNVCIPGPSATWVLPALVSHVNSNRKHRRCRFGLSHWYWLLNITSDLVESTKRFSDSQLQQVIKMAEPKCWTMLGEHKSAAT